MNNIPEQPSGDKNLIKVEDISALLARYLNLQWQCLKQQRRIFLSSNNPEAVHKMRVSIRRIRSILRSLDYHSPGIQKDGRWLAKRLGRVRDLDITLTLQPAEYSALSDSAPCNKHRRFLEQRKQSITRTLLEALRSKRCKRFIKSIGKFSKDLSPIGKTSKMVAMQVLTTELDRTLEMGPKAGSQLSPEQLHQLRIQCKKLRYLTELFSSDENFELTQFHEYSQKLQDVLGLLHDEYIAIKWLREYTGELPLTDQRQEELLNSNRQIHSHEIRIEQLRRAFSPIWSEFIKRCTQDELGKALRADASAWHLLR